MPPGSSWPDGVPLPSFFQPLTPQPGDDGNGGTPPAPPEFTVSISGAGVVTFGGNQTGDVSVEIVDGKLEFSRGTVKAANKDITVGQLALQAAFPEGVTVVITGLTAGPVNVAQATRIWRDRRLLRLKPESPCRVAKVKFTTWRATRLTCR